MCPEDVVFLTKKVLMQVHSPELLHCAGRVVAKRALVVVGFDAAHVMRRCGVQRGHERLQRGTELRPHCLFVLFAHGAGGRLKYMVIN